MNRTATLLLFFPLLLLFSTLHCQQVGSNPGVTVTIGSEALASGLAYTLPNILTQKLINSSLPNVVGTTRELLILQISYNISNIHIFNFEVAQLELTIIDGGFEAQLSGVVSNLTFDWWYRDQSFLIIHVTDSGNGTLSFSGGTYDLKFEIQNKNGQPFFDITTNSLTLHNFDLHLDGGADWFYDLFNFIITPIIKSTIESQVEDIVSAVFDEFNSLILNIPVNYPISNDLLFNWELIDDFVTNAEGFGTFYSAGYFVPRNNFEATPPFSLQFIPNQVNTEEAQLVISEFTFNSLGWALYEAGALNISLPFGTTNDWRVILPAFYRAFPGDNVTISLDSQIYPTFNINSTGITLNIAPYMYWYAEDPVQGNRTEAFTLLLEIEATVNLYFNDTTQLLHGKVGVPTFQMTLYSSNIGSFSLFQLETAINTVIYVAILPTINGILDAGIPIPTILGVTLKDPTIGFSDGYMYLTSDAEYTGLPASTNQPMKGARYTFVPEEINPYL